MHARAFLLALILGFLAVALGLAQSKVHLQMGTLVLMAGEVAEMSMTLQTNGQKISAVENELTLPAPLLFVAASLGDAVKPAAARIEAEAVPAGAKARQSKLRVRIEAARGKLLPDGAIGVLKFKLASKVPEKDLPVYLSVQNKVTATDAQNRPLSSDSGGGNVILVKEPAISACFFYMH